MVNSKNSCGKKKSRVPFLGIGIKNEGYVPSPKDGLMLSNLSGLDMGALNIII